MSHDEAHGDYTAILATSHDSYWAEPRDSTNIWLSDLQNDSFNLILAELLPGEELIILADVAPW